MHYKLVKVQESTTPSWCGASKEFACWGSKGGEITGEFLGSHAHAALFAAKHKQIGKYHLVSKRMFL